MPLQWPTVQFIRDGEDFVRGDDTNRPLQQLELRTRYLYERLNSVEAGEALISQGAVLEAETRQGSPVYFDPTTGVFRSAFAGVVLSAGADYGFASPEAQVRGIVLTKTTSTSGDVLLEGKARNTYGIDWAAVIDGGELQAGTYYVSAVTRGNLSRSRSALSVYVGTLDSAGTLMFHPEVNGNLRSHLHYKFDLLATISADLTGAGWVPVAQFISAGIQIPAGATYGYNVAKDAALSAAFPPVPLQSHHLEFIGKGVHEDAYVLDENGLWWVDSTVTPDALSSDADFPLLGKYYRLWISRLEAETTLVSKLSPSQSTEALPVVFRNSRGAAASSGELVAGLESLGTPTDTQDTAGVAVKGFTGVKFTTGPVVSTLVAGDNVTIEASQSSTAGKHGVVRISAGTNGVQNGEPSLVALDNAVEDFYGSIPCLVLPKGRTSSISARVNIPTNFTGTRRLRLTLDLVGTVGLSSQSLTLSYQQVRVGTPIVSGATSLGTLAFDLTAGYVTRVTSGTPVVVSPGDTVYFTVAQTNAGVTYGLPILRLQYELSNS